MSGNNGYDYYYYDNEPKFLDITDPKVGNEDVVDTEIGTGTGDMDEDAEDIQDDLVRTHSTLPPTQKPTNPPSQI